MPNHPRAGAAATWRIHSVPIRTRDGLERLDQVYRRLLETSPSALPLPQAETSPPCAPPSMPASRPSARNASRPSTASSTALRGWVTAEGHRLAEEHVFRDEGYSGARLDRPGLDALRDAVRDGAVELVAVLSPDRLARRYAYQVLLLEEFRRAGCQVDVPAASNLG